MRLLFKLVILSLVLLCQSARAWGPHPEITQAALDAMGPENRLLSKLAGDAQRLTQYVWMADWRTQLLVRADEVFYADDYLLFPKAKVHSQHICPEVQQNYSPFFRRALQALRTESPRNAARWIGSLLHFTTDTGSPPHAAGFLGPAHSKMENWVDAKMIRLPGYYPQLLGEDDLSAEQGFLRRMEGLIEFSKERAARCRADVDADRREAVEPVVLESALETARVTADLLHTLGYLAAKSLEGGMLRGRVLLPRALPPAMDRLPAKVVLLGTDFSTLTDADGGFSFRNLPQADYRLVAVSPGGASAVVPVILERQADFLLPDVSIIAEPNGNLLRNADFQLRWVSSGALDFWSLRAPQGKLAAKTTLRDWEGEWVPLDKGASYRLSARWKNEPNGTESPRIFVRSRAFPGSPGVPVESEPLESGTDSVTVTGGAEAAWAQVCVRSAKPPEQVLESVVFKRESP